MDENAGYQNASQLVTALTQSANAQIAGLTIGAHTIEHILVAYNNLVTGGVTIDDVTITNTTGAALLGATTATAGITVSAIDMVNIIGTAANPASVGSLHASDVQFFHG